eukprot:476954_1
MTFTSISTLSYKYDLFTFPCITLLLLWHQSQQIQNIILCYLCSSIAIATAIIQWHFIPNDKVAQDPLLHIFLLVSNTFTRYNSVEIVEFLFFIVMHLFFISTAFWYYIITFYCLLYYIMHGMDLCLVFMVQEWLYSLALVAWISICFDI